MKPDIIQHPFACCSARRAAVLLLLLPAADGRASPPVILFQPVEQRAVAGGRTELGVSAQCAPGDDCTLTYQWLRDGQPVAGAVNRLAFFDPVRTGDAGTWQVVVRGSAGESRSQAVTLHVTEDPPAPGTLDPGFAAPNIGNPSGSVRGTVYAIAPAADGGVLIGGDFTQVGGLSRPGLAKLTADGGMDPLFSLAGLPALPAVRCLVAVPGGWMAGGSAFTVRRPWLAFIPATGGPVISLESGWNFAAASGQEVRALLTLPDGRVMAGGTFSATAPGYSAARLIRLKADRRLDTTLPAAGWNAGVLALALTSAGNIVAGGSFSAPRRCVARLLADGSVDAAFQPPASTWTAAAEISALAVQSSGRIIAGGKFTFTPAGSFIRYALTAFLPEGAPDDNFSAKLNTDSKAEVRALLTDGPDKIIIGGRFTEITGADAAGGIFKVPWSGAVWLNNSGRLVLPQRPSAWDDRTVFSLAMLSPRRLLAGGDFAWPAHRLTALRADEPAAFAPVIHHDPVPRVSARRAGDSLRLSVAAAAWPEPSYQWLRNGAVVQGAVQADYFVPRAVAEDAASYTVRVSNALGDVVSGPASVGVHSSPPGCAPLVSAASAVPLTVAQFTSNLNPVRVAVPFAPARITVALRITHKDTNDLSATLISPGGQRARLFNQPGPSGRDFDDTVFDDTSTQQLSDALPPFRGTFQTGGALHALRAFPASGDWFLEIENNGGQTAVLESWQLFIEGFPVPVTYDSWRNAALSGAVLTAPGEDADGDGESNMGEFLFGPAPWGPFTVPGGIHSMIVTPGGTRILNWCGWQAADYQLECSPDLLQWQSAVEGVDCVTTWTSRTEPARREHSVRLNDSPVNRFWRLRGR